MRFSRIEKGELARAWLIISLAFAIAMSGPNRIAALFSAAFLIPLLFSAITVGVAFLGHELAHKLVAQHYGLYAEFRASRRMLLLSLLMSFFGFIFFAPGGVVLGGRMRRDEYGKISSAGILANLSLGLAFLAIKFSTTPGILNLLASFGAYINAWLAFFNMLPMPMFDGYKILMWNKRQYALIAFACVILLFFAFGF